MLIWGQGKAHKQNKLAGSLDPMALFFFPIPSLLTRSCFIRSVECALCERFKCSIVSEAYRFVIINVQCPICRCTSSGLQPSASPYRGGAGEAISVYPQ